MATSPLDEDGFHSIAWDDAPPKTFTPSNDHDTDGDGFEDVTAEVSTIKDPMAGAVRSSEGEVTEWNGKWMHIDVRDPIKEHEGGKDMFVSYAVRTKTNLGTFSSNPITVRRRFQDFVFLRDHLTKNFPACVVPPIPDKHRLEYIKGDRFSPEFIERRRADLQRFASRIARHPTLQRSQLVSDFLQSSEWTVTMHTHISHPPPDSHQSIMDNLSDTLVNAFSKVRKPDERFLQMQDDIEKYEEGLAAIEKLAGRGKGRLDDLAADYQDYAAAFQGLGYLESGITEPLNRFAEKLLDYSLLLKHMNHSATEPFLIQTHSLLQYANAHRSVIKLRDQKQLDFEELSAYLSAVVAERDRLAALSSGHAGTPVGLGTYLRDKVDQLRGTDDIHTRRERMRKLDTKIKELQDAVTTAHETSTAFSDEILKEHTIFELDKREEMKELLGGYADGQIEYLSKALEEWDRVIPVIQRIRVDV